MYYLVRYAHLKHRPNYEPGDKLHRNYIIGRMGNTGQSTADHLHFDLTQFKNGKHLPKHVYRLSEIHKYIKDLPGLMKQYHYFIDDEMFDCPVRITTSFGDPTYIISGKWKNHPGFDLVPVDKACTAIHWNRSVDGTVHMVGYDNGYGNYIIIKYEVK